MPRTEFRAKVGAAVPPPPDRTRTVPSILFTLRPDDGARVATLDGRGFGHAIGMSQWGAYGKALRGMKAPADPGRLLRRHPAHQGAGRQAPGPGAGGDRQRQAISAPALRRRPPGNRHRSRRPVPEAAANGQPRAKSAAAPPAGAADAVVSASGTFRILDSKGKVVVPVATGSWKIVPAAKGLRLLPPRDQAGAPGLTVLGIEPPPPPPASP